MLEFSNNLKAIETNYRGYKFRSRLEARWAVYLDTVGFKWEYETEGFDLEGESYLPDFLINLGYHQVWLEIKREPASWSLLDNPGKDYEVEIRKAKKLAYYTRIDVLFGFGLPSNYCFYGVSYEECCHWEYFTFSYGLMPFTYFCGKQKHERGLIAARSARFEFESFHQSL